MRIIGVITDVHGNLPALMAILAEFDKLHADEVIHCGDIVDMGPNSVECLHLLSSRDNVTMLLGNHDKDFLYDDYIAKKFSHVPTEHKRYVFDSLSEADRRLVDSFPLTAERVCGGQKLTFTHYAFDKVAFTDKKDFMFAWIDQHPTAEFFDKVFDGWDCAAVFFGHKHEPCDIVGKRLYVDVGSVGCHPEPVATGIVIEYDDSIWNYRRIAVPYDTEGLREDILKLPYGKEVYDFYFLRKHVTF